jgi:ankyrin repeat protein
VLAISNGHFDVAKYLLDNGADPNSANIDGLAPLYAVLDNRWAPVAWSPNSATAATGVVQQKVSHLELMKTLLERGADPNAKVLRTLWFNPPHHNQSWAKVPGTTPFWRAAQGSDIAAMKLLVAYGADPYMPSDSGLTPLAVATGIGWSGNYSTNGPDGFLKTSQYLVELGLDVNAADEDGFTPLMGAAWRGDNELVQYLVDHGAKVDARNSMGWAVTDMANGPSLRSSVPKKYPETIALLQKLGAPEPIKIEDEEILGIIKRKYDPVTGKFVTEPEKKK